MEVHYTCIWASSLDWNLKIDAVESVLASVFCVCKRERLVPGSGPKFFPPSLDRQIVQYFNVSLRFLSYVCVSLRVGSCPLCGSSFSGRTSRNNFFFFSSYVLRFVLSNCSERANLLDSFTVVSFWSMSPVHFSRMKEQPCTAECNVSFGWNGARGRRVLRCSQQ